MIGKIGSKGIEIDVEELENQLYCIILSLFLKFVVFGGFLGIFNIRILEGMDVYQLGESGIYF